MSAIDIMIEDDRWEKTPMDLAALARDCHDKTAAIDEKISSGSVSLLFADDARLQALNARFRNLSKPTNVLSFPSDDPMQAFLGDVALSFDTCEREAAAAGLTLADHTAHLIVHGLLHLIGYDHQTDEEAGLMEPLEVRILMEMGISDPYKAKSK